MNRTDSAAGRRASWGGTASAMSINDIVLPKPRTELSDDQIFGQLPASVRSAAGPPRTVAFVFPGLGSQRPGIGVDLAETLGVSTYDWASQQLGWDVLELLRSPDLDAAEKSYAAQVAMFCVSLASLEVLHASGIWPSFVAGHSLGETAALVAAGVLDRGVALRLVMHRAETMRRVIAGQQRTGSMIAVLGLDLAVVKDAMAEAANGQVLEVANDNAPGNVVVAGERGALERCTAAVTDRGARRVIPLLVDCAFHSSLMAPVVAAMRPYFAAMPMHNPCIPFVSNTTARVCNSGEQLRVLLTEQLVSPVYWADSVRELVALGVDTFVEVGPGTVLAGLIRRIAPEAHVFSAGTSATATRTVSRLAHG